MDRRLAELANQEPFTVTDVARICFGMSADWFYAARRDLEADGFPPPLAVPTVRGTRGRPRLRYSREAIYAWKRTQVPEHLRGAVGLPTAPANDDRDGETHTSSQAHKAKIEGRFL